MKYSNIALKIAVAKECGIITSNAQFWKEFTDMKIGEGDSGSRHAMEAAKKYGIDRYVMYNKEQDENDKRFGINKYLIDNDKKENVKILNKSNIEKIKTHRNPNFKKWNYNYNIQMSFDYSN